MITRDTDQNLVKPPGNHLFEVIKETGERAVSMEKHRLHDRRIRTGLSADFIEARKTNPQRIRDLILSQTMRSNRALNDL